MSESAPPPAAETVLSVDPGSVKCGLAVVSGPPAARLLLSVVATERLVVEVAAARRRFPQIARLLVGGGTGSATLRRALRTAFSDLPLLTVDEHGSSARARRRFVDEIPGPGWRRFLPRSLRVPERPYDDFVALLLAEDYFSRDVGTNLANGQFMPTDGAEETH